MQRLLGTEFFFVTRLKKFKVNGSLSLILQRRASTTEGLDAKKVLDDCCLFDFGWLFDPCRLFFG